MMLSKRLDPESYPYDDDAEAEEALPPDANKHRTAVLATADNNMGVEQEFLNSYPAAILTYKNAANFAANNLGPEEGSPPNL